MKNIQKNELDKFNSKNVLSDSPIPPKYEDTPLTNFPAAEDNWKRMSDITSTLLPVALQYNTLWDLGKIDEANALLKSYPALIDTIFNADKWNKLRDAIIAIERYYLNDVTEFIKHVAQSAIGINDNPEEENKTVVTYSALKIDELLAELRNYVDNKNNENLLDNWFFINPINQKGKTSYSESGFTIDRWKKIYNEGTISLSENGIIISGNITKEDGELMLQQIISSDIVHSCLGNSMCLSAGIHQGSGVLQVFADDNFYSTEFNVTNGEQLVTLNFSIPYKINLENIIVNIVNNGTSDLIISYIKLEKGNISTLAKINEEGNLELINPAPNRTLEFLKCLSSTIINGGFEVDSLDSLGVALDLNFVRPSDSKEVTLYANQWEEYKYVIRDNYITPSNIIEMFPGSNQSDEQLKALTDACMIGVKQETGALTVKANKTPTIDTNVLLIFRKDI